MSDYSNILKKMLESGAYKAPLIQLVMEKGKDLADASFDACFTSPLYPERTRADGIFRRWTAFTPWITVTEDVNKQYTEVRLPTLARDRNYLHVGDLLIVDGVDGYNLDGYARTPGKSLILEITSIDANTSDPIVKALNGRKTNREDETGTPPRIPEGTRCYLIPNASNRNSSWDRWGDGIGVHDYFSNNLGQQQSLSLPLTIDNWIAANYPAVDDGMDLEVKADIETFLRDFEYMLLYGNTVGGKTLGNGFKYSTAMTNIEGRQWTFSVWSQMVRMYFSLGEKPRSGILLAGSGMVSMVTELLSGHKDIMPVTISIDTYGNTVYNITTPYGMVKMMYCPTFDWAERGMSGIFVNPDMLGYLFENRADSDKIMLDAINLGNGGLYVNGDTQVGRNYYESGYFTFSMLDGKTDEKSLLSGDLFVVIEDRTINGVNLERGMIRQCVKKMGDDGSEIVDFQPYQGDYWY